MKKAEKIAADMVQKLRDQARSIERGDFAVVVDQIRQHLQVIITTAGNIKLYPDQKSRNEGAELIEKHVGLIDALLIQKYRSLK